jgi:SAM-dependent methyltransferase
MANAQLCARMHRIVRRSGIRPKRVLEVGGYVDERSLLHAPELAGAERFCINLVGQPEDTGIRHVVGSSNDMHMFKDDSFDIVLSNAVHEHDRKFWLSIAEMQRVLRPGGLMVVCVPGFVRGPGDRGATTDTYKVHYKFDYYRFSRRAVREVFFEGMERVKVVKMLEPPRLIGHGFKPLTRRQRAVRGARRRLARLRPGLHRRNMQAAH